MKLSSKDVDADFCLPSPCFLPSGFLDYCFSTTHPASTAGPQYRARREIDGQRKTGRKK